MKMDLLINVDGITIEVYGHCTCYAWESISLLWSLINVVFSFPNIISLEKKKDYLETHCQSSLKKKRKKKGLFGNQLRKLINEDEMKSDFFIPLLSNPSIASELWDKKDIHI